MTKKSGIWLHMLIIHSLDSNAARGQRTPFVLPVSLRASTFPGSTLSCPEILQFRIRDPHFHRVHPHSSAPRLVWLCVQHTGCVEGPASHKGRDSVSYSAGDKAQLNSLDSDPRGFLYSLAILSKIVDFSQPRFPHS